MGRICIHLVLCPTLPPAPLPLGSFSVFPSATSWLSSAQRPPYVKMLEESLHLHHFRNLEEDVKRTPSCKFTCQYYLMKKRWMPGLGRVQNGFVGQKHV